MRTLTAIALALATTAAVPAIAAAQESTPQNAPMNETTGETTTTPAMGAETTAQKMMPPVITAQGPDQVLSDKYIGAKVVANSAEGVESVGKVSDLLLDSEDKIVGVVVDVGGFLGVAAKPVGLSWASLSEQQSEGELLLRTSLSRQELEDAPEFKTLQEQQVETDRKMIEQEQAPAAAPAQ